MNILVTGGGTGGHLSIADALIDALNKRGHRVAYMGSTSGQDQTWFEDDTRCELYLFMLTSGVVNQRGVRKIEALWKVFNALFHARNALKTFAADAVVSVGGFSAAPASLASLTLGIPLFIHEQNAVTGRLNALLKPFAKAFFSSYDEHSPVRGYPVKAALFERARARDKVSAVIFLGGSQGAKYVNDVALSLAPTLKKRGITIIHQAGKNDEMRVRKTYAAMGIDAEVYGFTKALPALLERADLAVGRAGASTLWELCANGLCAVYIPYPYAAGDHQYHNAQFLVERDLAWCVREGEGVEEAVLAALDAPFYERSEALMRLCDSSAAAHIIEAIEERIC